MIVCCSTYGLVPRATSARTTRAALTVLPATTTVPSLRSGYLPYTSFTRSCWRMRFTVHTFDGAVTGYTPPLPVDVVTHTPLRCSYRLRTTTAHARCCLHGLHVSPTRLRLHTPHTVAVISLILPPRWMRIHYHGSFSYLRLPVGSHAARLPVLRPHFLTVRVGTTHTTFYLAVALLVGHLRFTRSFTFAVHYVAVYSHAR